MERQDLEKWIENYPEILNEDLEIISSEYDKFDKTGERIDILALDKEGNLVIIELKRVDSGKNVDLQALKYAAFCSTLMLDDVYEIHNEYHSKKSTHLSKEDNKAKIDRFLNEEVEEISDRPRIILVATDFKPEVSASVIWLRKFEIDIRCIKITPYLIDVDIIVIESNVIIPVPEAEEYMIRRETKEKIEYSKSTRSLEYIDFFDRLRIKAEEEMCISIGMPKGKNYLQIPTGKTSVHYEWSFHGRPRESFSVSIDFEKGDHSKNLELLNRLSVVKSTVEASTNEQVVIKEQWGTKWARIFIEKNNGELSQENMDWGVQVMKALYDTAKPILENI